MKRGVLIVAFGGARDEGEVEDFLRELRGELPPWEFLEVIKERYRSIGGSPLFAILERIVEGLRRRLRGVSVQFGVLYGRPKIEEAIEHLEDEGAFEVLVLPLSPYRSPFTAQALERARRRLDELALPVRTAPAWFAHPGHLRLWASRIREELSSFGRAPILFTAHSLPEDQGQGYLEDLKATVRGIAGLLPGLSWQMAFHGQRPGWIGPGLSEALKEMKASGAEGVMVVPVGFPCDHLETLYDLDVDLKREAEELGMAMARVSCLNASEDFVTFLAMRVLEAFSR